MDERILRLLREVADDLEDPDPYWSPSSEIHDLGDEAVPLLVEVLQHDEPLMRKMAAFSLGDLQSLWDELPSPDLTSAIPHLERVLKNDPAPEVRRKAAEALWRICEHEVALQAFLDGLHDDDVEFRRWGAAMLGWVEGKAPESIQPLIDALDDPDLVVRRNAAEALEEFGSVAALALPKLESLLGEDEATRIIGVEAIMKIDPSRTEQLSPILADALGSRSRRIRHHVVQTLGDLPNAGGMAIPELIGALDDEDEAVRMATLGTLERLGLAAAPAVPTLIKILRGEGREGDDVLVRGQAAAVLAAIGEEAHEAAYFLHECLDELGDDDATTYFRLRVAHAIWRISGDPDHPLTRAVELLGNPDWWLRYRAATVLGDLGAAGRAAIPDLREALKDEHPTVRRSAGESLERIDPTP